MDTQEPTKIDTFGSLDEFREGLNLIRNTRFADAEEYFTKAVLLVPENKVNLWWNLHNTEVTFWKAALSSDDPELMKIAFERAAIVEEIASDLYKKATTPLAERNEPTSIFSFVKKTILPSTLTVVDDRLMKESSVALGELYLGYAIVYFRTQSYPKGAYYLRKSWKLYESLLKLKLEEDEALRGRIQFGIGLFHLVISLVPSSFLWLVEMIGFKANREHAFLELNACRESNCGRAVEASILLVLVNWFFLEKKEEAEIILKDVLDHYQTSSVFKMVAAFIENRNGNIDKAVRYFEEATEHAKEVPQLQLTAQYEQGHCYFLMCQWAKAIPATERYIDESKSPNFKAFGSFKLGFCYWMLGSKERLAAIYIKIPNYVRPSFSFDRYALRMSKKCLNNFGFTTFDELNIQANNFCECKMYNSALSKVEEMVVLMESGFEGPERPEDVWGMYHYLKGRVMRGLQQYSEANENFQKVLKMEEAIQEEKHIVPHTLTELGELYSEQEEYEAAKTYFQRAKAIPGPYDFDRPCQLRISRGLEKIKRKNKGK